MYEVVYPLGKLTQDIRSDAARLQGLNGMTIAEISNHKFGSELTFAELEKVLLQRYPTLKLIPHEKFGDMYGPEESRMIKELPEKLKLYECDAVISGNGG